MPPVWKTWLLREEVKKNISLRNKMANYTKQIFGHGYILKVIPEEYDMIIRVRYDTLISDKVDFNHYLNMSYNDHKAGGFGIRTGRHNKLHELKPLPHVWPKKDGPSPGISNDWGGYLMDPLIFHRRDMWNSKLMYKLNEEKKLNAAIAWSRWEGSTSSLSYNPDMANSFSDPKFALAFALIENHYFINQGFLDHENQLIESGIPIIRDIPTVIVQGRYDIVCPMRTAWELSQNWPEAKLIIAPSSGHTAFESEITHELIKATNTFSGSYE